LQEGIPNVRNQESTDMYWYAINPTTRRICKVREYRSMIVLAVAVAAGALIGICAICLCYMRHRLKQCSRHNYPQFSHIQKFDSIFLPSPPTGSSHDMLYETQMLEMPVGEDDAMMKPADARRGAGNGAMLSSNYNINNDQSYKNYSQNGLVNEATEDAMYAFHGQTRINHQ
uniref:Cadherin_C domain-containing protein n=1 Tax=Gongylonema pulchrum TaxID=637853 RepID=A0A183D6V4_9BILA